MPSDESKEVTDARQALDEALGFQGLFSLRSMGAEYGVIERLVRAILAEQKAESRAVCLLHPDCELDPGHSGRCVRACPTCAGMRWVEPDGSDSSAVTIPCARCNETGREVIKSESQPPVTPAASVLLDGMARHDETIEPVMRSDGALDGGADEAKGRDGEPSRGGVPSPPVLPAGTLWIDMSERPATRRRINGEARLDGKVYRWLDDGVEMMCPAIHIDWSSYTPPAPVASGAKADPLHPDGKCTCAGEGRCEWCVTRCADCGVALHEDDVRVYKTCVACASKRLLALPDAQTKPSDAPGTPCLTCGKCPCYEHERVTIVDAGGERPGDDEINRAWYSSQATGKNCFHALVDLGIRFERERVAREATGKAGEPSDEELKRIRDHAVNQSYVERNENIVVADRHGDRALYTVGYHAGRAPPLRQLAAYERHLAKLRATRLAHYEDLKAVGALIAELESELAKER